MFDLKRIKSGLYSIPSGTAVWGELNKTKIKSWFLASTVNKFDKLAGHLINCGNEYYEICSFLEKTKISNLYK